jgi:hypothetical protein
MRFMQERQELRRSRDKVVKAIILKVSTYKLEIHQLEQSLKKSGEDRKAFVNISNDLFKRTLASTCQKRPRSDEEDADKEENAER